MSDKGVAGSIEMYVIIGAILVAATVIGGFFLVGIPVSSSPAAGNSSSGNTNAEHIYKWSITPDEIHATTQPDGTATWSGTINVTVYDQNGHPVSNVNVLLEGCGITVGETTNATGTVILHVVNVTLQKNVQADKITVNMSYNGQTKTDTILVIRGS